MRGHGLRPARCGLEVRRVEGDGGTLAGLPFELLVRQGAAERYVRATDGAVRLPGTARPEVLSVGVPLRIR